MTDSIPRAPGPPVSEADKKAFVAYYNEKSIIPVSQDVTDPDFIFKRNALYQSLGIPLPALRDRSILEFGPGGGYNAIATSHHGPALYVVVDASRASLDELHRKAALGRFDAAEFEIVESNIFDYRDGRPFDLVIIEGVIPGQTKPAEMLQHAASFVTKGGVLTTTTTTATSLLSEVCRRLFRPYILDRHASFEAQTEEAARIFGPHLATLNTRTRPARDWVLDTILHRWEKGAIVVFSMLDSIRALGDAFDFYGSSPRFLIDDRFYKTVSRSAPRSSTLVEQQFPTLSLALLDHRVSLLDVMRLAIPLDVESRCEELLHLHVDILESNGYARLDAFLEQLRELGAILPACFAGTARAIDEFANDFPRFIAGSSAASFDEFARWWGRGQQYVSFVRAT